MKRLLTAIAPVLAIATVALVFPLVSGAFGGPSGRIGLGRVGLHYSELSPAPNTIRAFVPTDSTDIRCLATLAETTTVIPGTTVYCADRDLNGVHGLLVSVFFPEDATPPPDLVVVVTLYQEHALQYGTPALYTGT